MKSKKLMYITASLVLLVSAGVMAQTIIPKAGMSFTNVTISEDIKELYNSPSIEYKTGFVGGVAVEFTLSELITIQPELLFHQKGYKMNASDEIESIPITYSETLTLNYLELPVMVKFNFGKFYANAGPVFGYGLGGNYTVEYSYFGDSEKYNGNVKFGTEPENYDGDDWYVDVPFEMGIGLGAGYKLGRIMLDLRYGIGLTSIYSNEEDFDWTTKNNSFQFTVGLPLGK